MVAIVFYGAVVGYLGLLISGSELVYSIVTFLLIAVVVYFGM